MMPLRNKRSVAIIALLALCAAGQSPRSNNPAPGAGESGRPPQTKAQETQQAPQPEQRGTLQTPLFVQIIQPQKTQEETAKDAEDEQEKARTDWWMIFLTGAVAVATFLQVFALWRTILTTRRQLRAYLSASVTWISNLDATNHAWAQFDINNHGQTPAYRMSNIGRVDILPFPLPRGFRLPHLSIPNTAGGSAVHTDQPWRGEAHAQRVFTAEEIDKAVRNDGLRIYIFGFIHYRDIFRKRRVTRFCISARGDDNLRIVASGGKVGNEAITFEAASQHNDTN